VRAPALAGTVLAGSTLAAGLVGVARQRAEVAAVREGRLAPASAASDVTPAREPGPLGRRVAAWIPPRPATPLGRLTVVLWSSPLSLVGVLLAVLAGRRPRWDTRHGCLVVDDIRGPSAAALRLVGADANTIGHVILSRHRRSPDQLLAHEAVHVRQGERLGPLLFPAYVWLAARYGYRDHPLERAARAGARRHGNAAT
jgi:hypothetical protein